ncbi:hypothetical protein NLJ89_g6966 [Agrocybe chaxingu]|uniref:NAD(P)-binding protein n=1 Tax=Agrocybe chaxingu TaxID=84603 RepID=A0A9W8MS65_9AGAR|nr:hypothetical protein NLJ89_g6966 [Agrocybe chaxingu]
MACPAAKRVLVVAGIGNGTGTGASTARLFAKNGYNVAIIARGDSFVQGLANEINSSGGEAASFTVPSYSHDHLTAAWASIHKHFPKPEYTVRAAVFNVAYGVLRPFLDTTSQEVQESLDTNVGAAFSFARGAILAFKDNGIEETNGARGTLIFTGSTGSVRGNVTTSAYAAGKWGSRALSQSLAKEFGQQNIHIAHSIIDGSILVDRQREHRSAEWAENEDIRLRPESIALSYLYLVNQDRSAWTWELDLRPAHEKLL